MKIFNVGVKGIGSYVPPHILTNENIDVFGIGTNAKWTEEKLGIRERHVVKNENTSDLAYEAALKAIDDSDLTTDDIDLIILATSSPDRMSPSTACIMAERLGVDCPAFDINAVCSGFIYGMQLATNLITTGQHRNILLIGAETYSKITNWRDRNCVFFGDGAGAVIVGEVNGGWISTDIFSDPTGKENFTCPIGGKFRMNGKAVYDFGTKVLPDTIMVSLDNLGLSTQDISWIIPHQPSINVLKKTAEILNIPLDKVVLNMHYFANTAGASIPMALDAIYCRGGLKNNDILVMPAVGSGWTWGVSILKYIKHENL
jgi:3-oxoacyl-[acyl-carrier-protein] synthase-3